MVKIEKYSAVIGGEVYAVIQNGKMVGFIEKKKSTRSDILPWEVYKIVRTSDMVCPTRVAIFFSKKVPAWNGDGPEYKHGGKREAFKFAKGYFAK